MQGVTDKLKIKYQFINEAVQCNLRITLFQIF